MSGKDDLWCRVLKSKYKVSNWIDYTPPSRVSKLWKDIIKLVLRVLDYVCWSIGDGIEIKPWTDCWIESGLAITDMNMQIPQELIHAKMKDFVGVMEIGTGSIWNRGYHNCFCRKVERSLH